MERDAVCFSRTGLGGGEQGLLRNDGSATGLENCGVAKGTLLPRSWLWNSFSVEIFRV